MMTKQQLKRMPIYAAIFVLIFYVTQILMTPGNPNFSLKFWDGKAIILPFAIAAVLTVLI